MGQFLQNGENVLFLKLSFSVPKPDKMDLISQLILDICIFVTPKTLPLDLGKNFGVALDT